MKRLAVAKELLNRIKDKTVLDQKVLEFIDKINDKELDINMLNEIVFIDHNTDRMFAYDLVIGGVIDHSLYCKIDINTLKEIYRACYKLEDELTQVNIIKNFTELVHNKAVRCNVLTIVEEELNKPLELRIRNDKPISNLINYVGTTLINLRKIKQLRYADIRTHISKEHIDFVMNIIISNKI